MGLEDDIKSAYKFLAETYTEGDRIFLIGFSRGAYAARSLAGMLGRIGLFDLSNPSLSDKEKWAAVHAALIRYQAAKAGDDIGFLQRALWLKIPKNASGGVFQYVDVHFLGVWDTVGSLGIPDDLGVMTALVGDPRKHAFHDTELGDNVKHARHAVAIDERRKDFTPTLWTNAEPERVKQLWFPGVHADVGGGYADHDLGDLTLRWMMQEAQAQGIAFREGAFERLTDNPQGVLHDSVSGVFKYRRTRPRSVPSFIRKGDGLSKFSEPALKRFKFPAEGEPEYWQCHQLKVNQTLKINISAKDRWNRTGVFLEQGKTYKLSARGEWLDASITAEPEGAKQGFHLAKGAYVLASIPEGIRGALRGFRATRNADNSLSRRYADAPWFALIGMISNGSGVDPYSQKLDTHQYFEIGRAREIVPEGDGYLYAFANDAWAAYGNNSGHVELTVVRTK